LETAQFQFARRRITYARKFRTIELLISELMLLRSDNDCLAWVGISELL